MKAERRDTPRVPAALETIVNFRDKSNLPTRTRDISLDGVFLEKAQDSVDENQLIDLAIRLPGNGQAKYHRFHGQVIRTTRYGAALMFDEVTTDAYAALMDFVFAQQGKTG